MKDNPPKPDRLTSPPGRTGQAPEAPPVDTTEVRGPLRLEKLEGRQEGGRDAQDEAEEDEGD